MAQELTESIEQKLDKTLQVKNVAHAYATKRECSVEEILYQVMPEHWLYKIFPAVIYANSNIPEKRVKIMLIQNKVNDVLDEATAIFKWNMLDHYQIRSVNGTHAELQEMCHAEFIDYYRKNMRIICFFFIPSSVKKMWKLENYHHIKQSYFVLDLFYIINENRCMIETFADLKEAAFPCFQGSMPSNLDAFEQQLCNWSRKCSRQWHYWE